jgi:hypothetical protein
VESFADADQQSQPVAITLVGDPGDIVVKLCLSFAPLPRASGRSLFLRGRPMPRRATVGFGGDSE